MSISFVGSKSSDISSQTSSVVIPLDDLSGGSGTSPSEGDVVVLAIYNNSSTRRTNTADVTGYTRVFGTNDVFSNASYDSNTTVWFKVMGPTPDTSVDVLPTNSSIDANAVHILVFSGVDGTTTLDVASVFSTGSGDDPNPPSITPVTTGAMIIAFAMAAIDYADLSGSSLTQAYLSNLVSASGENVDSGRAVLANTGTVSWGGGAYDPTVITGDAGTVGGTWAAATLALRPSASVSIPALGAISSGSISSSSIGFSVPVTF